MHFSLVSKVNFNSRTCLRAASLLLDFEDCSADFLNLRVGDETSDEVGDGTSAGEIRESVEVGEIRESGEVNFQNSDEEMT